MTGCGQHQLTPSPAFVGEKLDQSLVVGERAGIERHTAGNFMLERGFAFQQPEGKLKDRERTLLQQRQQRFPQQIGPDERAIKIDTQGTFGVEILTHGTQEGFYRQGGIWASTYDELRGCEELVCRTGIEPTAPESRLRIGERSGRRLSALIQLRTPSSATAPLRPWLPWGPEYPCRRKTVRR